MAQLSEKLVRDAIKCIREERKLMLTINEVDQALHAWLVLNFKECCRRSPCLHPGVGPCDMPRAAAETKGDRT